MIERCWNTNDSELCSGNVRLSGKIKAGSAEPVTE
jgi:hypothetical protein